MTRNLCLIMTLVIGMTVYFYPQPEAKAIDPVTIAILAPIAIKAAQIMAPYVIKALKNMGVVMLKAGGELLQFFRLPIGLFQSTIFAPWAFSSGMKNIGKGVIAPFKMTGYILLLPLSAFGVGVR